MPTCNGEQLFPLPSWGLQLSIFYPFSTAVGQLESSARRTGDVGEGRLSVLQMRCLHNHRPCLRLILLAPRDATGNGPNAQVKHLWMLDLLLISATWVNVAWTTAAAQGIELLKTYPTACALRGLC